MRNCHFSEHTLYKNCIFKNPFPNVKGGSCPFRGSPSSVSTDLACEGGLLAVERLSRRATPASTPE
eukprot:scaffold193_cov255-Pinguiococcus_pyrenoidosus.AAC.8